jgi:hypothetical protein
MGKGKDITNNAGNARLFLHSGLALPDTLAACSSPASDCLIG